MYKTILVPLDGSKRAEAILPHVEEIARRYRAKVVFVQVIEPMPLTMGPEDAYIALEERQIEDQTRQAKSYLAALQGTFHEKGIPSRSHVLRGPVVEGILVTAEREGADLVAIASHGRTGLARVFYGSVAAGVLHAIDRPLLLIRSRGEE